MKHRSELLREEYESVIHKSGLPIYVFPKKMTSTYAVFSVRYGGMDDCLIDSETAELLPLPDGVAHFLEHKLFDNPDGSDSFAAFSSYGADANAYTTCNRTAYLFSCTDHFDESLAELLRFVTTPYFTEQTVQKEQGIIAEEIRMYDDSPWDRCFQSLMEGLYCKNGVRKSVCGSVESIASITPELLYAAYRYFYRLSNMALVVCGDVTLDRVLQIADAVLPQTAQGEARPVRPTVAEPRSVCQPIRKSYMQVSKPIFSIGIKDNDAPSEPAARLRRDAAMSILEEILFSRSGSFYSELFEQGLLTPSYSYGYSIEDRFAFHGISGESDQPELVCERLKAHLQRTLQEGISEEDFERCRRVLYADEIRGYDSTEEIANILLSFVFDDAELFDYPELLQSIKKDELPPLLEHMLREDALCLSVVYPLEEAEDS